MGSLLTSTILVRERQQKLHVGHATLRERDRNASFVSGFGAASAAQKARKAFFVAQSHIDMPSEENTSLFIQKSLLKKR